MKNFKGYLTEEEIEAIVNIFANTRSVEYEKNTTRRDFLKGIDSAYVSGHLEIVSADPNKQLRIDLINLSSTESIVGDKVPLWNWLKAAERTFAPIQAQSIFTRLLEKVPSRKSFKPDDDTNERPAFPESGKIFEKIVVFFKRINKKAVWSLVIGISAVILLIFLKVFFDQTAFGYEKNIDAYEFLNYAFSSRDLDEELPVVVLDISDLKSSPNEAVPPDKLQEIVQGLIESGAGAIAIDINFTPRFDRINPEESGLRHEDDLEFFNYLLKQKAEGHPVFLGVNKFDAEPESWLGLDEYKELAADMTLCDEEKCKDTNEIPLWLQCEGYPKLYSISKSLANFHENNPQPPKSIKPFLKDYENEENLIKIWLPDINGNKIPCQRAMMPVNYAKLQLMEKFAQPTITKEAVLQANNKFKNKLVIIGKARLGETTSNLNVVGRDEVVPGIFIPAMGIYTLISDPIYKLKPWVTMLLDFLIGTALIFGLFIIRLWKGKNNKSAQKSELVFLLAFILIILFSGALFVRVYNVLWLDFVLVIFAPLLYSKFENKPFNRLFSNNKSDA